MIYYIYKVRRKQTSIRSSRSALPHRYLRSISWNDHRPQPSTSWVSTCAPPRVASCAPAYDEVPHPAALLLLLSPSRRERKYLLVFSREKEKHLSSLSRASLTRRSSCVALPTARTCRQRPIRGRSAACRPRRFLRPSHKQKNAGPRHCAANPLTTKSADFSLKKTHVGTPGFHALASAARTYSLTARIHYCSFSFLLFYKGKEKRKQKQIQQVRIHRSDSLRSSSRCTRLARRASSTEIYVAIATRFVQDCVEDLAPLAASMERTSKCSWHIKDQCPGVSKASRIFLLLLRFSKFFPHKNLTFPKKSDILYTQDEERKQNSSLPSVIFKYEKANSTNRWCGRKVAKAATGHR